MSYILEALRRAETERERKRRIPGLHAQPVPVTAPDDPGPRRSKAWLWVALGLGAGVLLPLAWRGWTDDPPSDDALGARAAVAGSVTPHSAASPDASPGAAPASAAAPPAVASAAGPAPPAAQQRPRTPQVTPTTPKDTATARAGPSAKAEPASRTPNVAPAAPVDDVSGATSGRNPKPAPAAAATAPEPRLRSLAELPDDLRRSVPQLAFGGSVYSETAAQRMVILNGQVLREGDAVTEELQLEQIRPRSAVMRLRGQRFEIVF